MLTVYKNYSAQLISRKIPRHADDPLSVLPQPPCGPTGRAVGVPGLRLGV